MVNPPESSSVACKLRVELCFVWPTYQTPDVRENAKTVVTATELAAVAREKKRKEYQIDKEWRAYIGG